MSDKKAENEMNNDIKEHISINDFEIIKHKIDPTLEDEACLLRSNLINPVKPCLISINDNKLFICKLCCLSYKTQTSLNKHIKFRHLIGHQNYLDSFYCKNCNKIFNGIMYIDNHDNNQKKISHFCKKLNNKYPSQYETHSIQQTCDILKLNDLINDLKSTNNFSGNPIYLLTTNNNNENNPINIPISRFESRKNETNINKIVIWLQYELYRKLTKMDYINASKIFIGIHSYNIASKLMNHYMISNPKSKNDNELNAFIQFINDIQH